jgi:hypothetical protein
MVRSLTACHKPAERSIRIKPPHVLDKTVLMDTDSDALNTQLGIVPLLGIVAISGVQLQSWALIGLLDLIFAREKFLQLVS